MTKEMMEPVLMVVNPETSELIHIGQPELFDEKQLLHYARTGFTIQTIPLEKFKADGYKLYEKIPLLTPSAFDDNEGMRGFPEDWDNIQWLNEQSSPSADVQERAKELGYDMATSELHTRIAWDKTCQERDDLKNQVKVLSAIKKGLEKSLTDAMNHLAGASGELEKLKAENERLREYIRHLPTCNINQNWDEALQALADTPQQFRDDGYYSALKEIEDKRRTCTCGLNQ